MQLTNGTQKSKAKYNASAYVGVSSQLEVDVPVADDETDAAAHLAIAGLDLAGERVGALATDQSGARLARVVRDPALETHLAVEHRQTGELRRAGRGDGKATVVDGSAGRA